MKSALIIGSEGQDGQLLKLFLSSKNYNVIGVGRQRGTTNDFLNFDLSEQNFIPLQKFIITNKPDEIYYVAAFHHSSQENKAADFEFIELSVKINQVAFIKVLEICRVYIPACKIVYTSSSLIYSGVTNTSQNETTITEPRCIYSVNKCGAMEAAKHYRNSYNMFVSVGIMYNHESIFRKDYFLSKKIVNETRMLLENKIQNIIIGDLSSVTDWGYAPDFVEALWHILQLKSPDIFIVSTGIAHKVQDWFEVLGKYLNFDWKKYVVENKALIVRKKPVLIGDNSKLVATGWIPKTGFNEMVIKMYNNEI